MRLVFTAAHAPDALGRDLVRACGLLGKTPVTVVVARVGGMCVAEEAAKLS